jgi:diacylglycerol kinase family enzyme
MGFDTEVTIMVHRFRKKWIPASQRFTLAILRVLTTFKPLKIKFKINGVVKCGEFVVVTSANGQCCGGAYYIAPEAQLQDGMMDICFIDKMSKMRMIKVINSAKTGSHVKDPHVHMRRTNHIKIHCDKPSPLNIDGEVLNANSYDIKVEKQAITMFNDQKFIEEIIGK